MNTAMRAKPNLYYIPLNDVELANLLVPRSSRFECSTISEEDRRIVERLVTPVRQEQSQTTSSNNDYLNQNLLVSAENSNSPTTCSCDQCSGSLCSSESIRKQQNESSDAIPVDEQRINISPMATNQGRSVASFLSSKSSASCEVKSSLTGSGELSSRSFSPLESIQKQRNEAKIDRRGSIDWYKTDALKTQMAANRRKSVANVLFNKSFASSEGLSTRYSFVNGYTLTKSVSLNDHVQSGSQWNDETQSTPVSPLLLSSPLERIQSLSSTDGDYFALSWNRPLIGNKQNRQRSVSGEGINSPTLSKDLQQLSKLSSRKNSYALPPTQVIETFHTVTVTVPRPTSVAVPASNLKEYSSVNFIEPSASSRFHYSFSCLVVSFLVNCFF